METYLLVMYVTQEQESAIHTLFIDNHWIFCKTDPEKLTCSRRVVYRYDSLDQVAPTIHTETDPVQKQITLTVGVDDDFQLLNDRNTSPAGTVRKIKLDLVDNVTKVETNLRNPDIALKECFVSLERLPTEGLNVTSPSPEISVKKSGRKRKITPSSATSALPVKKETSNGSRLKAHDSRLKAHSLSIKPQGSGLKAYKLGLKAHGSGLKVRLSVNKGTKSLNTNNDDNPSTVSDAITANNEIVSDMDSKSNKKDDTIKNKKTIKDETVKSIKTVEAEREIEKTVSDDNKDIDDDVNDNIGDDDDDIDDIEDIEASPDINDDSDSSFKVEDSGSNDEGMLDSEYELEDPDYGTKIKKKQKPKKEKLQCEKCSKIYISRMSYDKHLESCGNKVIKKKVRKVDENSGHGEYKCETCLHVYTYKRKYISHYVDGVCRFKCKYCGKIFRNELSRHIFHKHDVGEERLRCEVCNKRIYDQSEMREHMMVHSEAKNYVCDQCGKAYNTPLSLYAHNKQQHDKTVPRAKCEICNRSFTSPSGLLYHTRITHSDERNCVCEVCGKRFKTNRCVRTHMKMHSDVRPYKCDICGKDYKYVHQMYNHKRLYHSKLLRYFCSFCEKGFYFESYLKDHMNIHTGNKPHSCDKCNYMCHTRMQLTQHRRKHRKPKVPTVESFHQPLSSTVIVEPVPSTSDETSSAVIPILD